jgi:transposase
MQVVRVGLDVAKNVFQVHGVDADGAVVLRRRLRRDDLLDFFAALPRCLVGLEACSASHHWARELVRLGHDARLMPARYVKPYVQRGKSDALDAAGICEAVSRPTMRFVAIKTVEQQSALALHRSREILVKQETMLVNLVRAASASSASWLRSGCAVWRSSSPLFATKQTTGSRPRQGSP